MPTLPLKDYLYLGAIVALVLAFGWFVHHERAIGRQQIEQADKTATAVLDAQVRVDEQIAQDAADKSAKERQDAQTQLDAYMAAHPTGPIRVCHAHDSGAGLPQTAHAGESAVSPSPGPDAVPEVPGRDISAGLDAIVRAATELDLLYQERQKLKE